MLLNSSSCTEGDSGKKRPEDPAVRVTARTPSSRDSGTPAGPELPLSPRPGLHAEGTAQGGRRHAALPPPGSPPRSKGGPPVWLSLAPLLASRPLSPDAWSDASSTISGGHKASPIPRPPRPTAVPKPRGCTVEALVRPACPGPVSRASGAFCLCPAPSCLVSKSPELCLTEDSKPEPPGRGATAHF